MAEEGEVEVGVVRARARGAAHGRAQACANTHSHAADNLKHAHTHTHTYTHTFLRTHAQTWEGELSAEGAPDGEGTMVYPDGATFVGTMQTGQRVTGTYTFADGSVYEGEYAEVSARARACA